MTGIIILAAGASTRFGSPKQKLRYKGKSLLQHAINTAIHSTCKPVVVVTGYNHLVINEEVVEPGIHVVQNHAWQTGMASSIKKGLEKILDVEPRLNSVLILLCDQPFVDVKLVQKIISLHHATSKNIIACSYTNTLGVPMLFNHIYFGELQNLTGQEGARKLIAKYPNDVAAVPFAEGVIDIDTREDYEALIRNEY